MRGLLVGENSKIEWCEHSLNWWIGCESVSPGCLHCYARDWAKRYGWDFDVRKQTTLQTRMKVFKWNVNAPAFILEHQRRPRVFVNSLSDVFDNQVPQDWRDSLFRTIRQCHNLDFLLLTKRIGNARKMLPHDWGDGWPNVWLMATICTQEELDRDLRKLMRLPAACRGLSVEPMLSNVQLPGRNASFGMQHNGDPDDGLPILGYPDFVICGGESGSKARSMRPEWVFRLQRNCKDQQVCFFMKQGSQANWADFKNPDAFPYQLRNARDLPASRGMSALADIQQQAELLLA